MAGEARTATLRNKKSARPRAQMPVLVRLFSEVGSPPDHPVPISSEVLIGRDESCAFALRDDSVSRRHARLSVNDGAVQVEDLGSRNGTRVGSRPVSGRVPLSPGQSVRVGRSIFLLADAARFGASWATRDGPMIGGPAVRQIQAFVERFGATTMPVLIEGETGSGKEVVVSEIHRASGRSGPLVPLNCAATPSSLFEAEVFGFRRGAFTGAVADKRGLLLEASRGTLFLDEVGELAPDNQARLLRALESGEFRPLGATRVERAEPRLVAATNRSLDKEVATGKFRADLYHRLNGVLLVVPPLRERPEDIVLLAEHFLKTQASETGVDVGLGADACEALLAYLWPGNVRELAWSIRAAAHRAAAEGRPHVTPEDLPDAIASFEPADPLAGARWQRVASALRDAGGNVTMAAKAVGLHRAQVYLLLRRHDARPADFRKTER